MVGFVHLVKERTMTKEIQLANGGIAIVDDEDYGYLSQWEWRLHKGALRRSDYAYRHTYSRGTRTTTWILMHRVILDAPSGMQVDHKDRNGLNNTRENLRLATHTQNQHNAARRHDNRSGFKGVRRTSRGARWDARICVDGKQKYLGCFATAEEAARAYDAAATELRGEFARLNF